MHAHPLLISVRSALRANPLARRAWKLWNASRDYEQSFRVAIDAAVRPGDVVWDVGANVGYYTRRFLERGASRVVCFEPAPEASSVLRQQFGEPGSADRVRVVTVALSDHDGTASFAASGADPTNRLGSAGGSGRTIDVALRRGDTACREFSLPDPDVLKIDVEGHEPDVLDGLGDLLMLPTLRHVFIEVHFALLEERGRGAAPAAMSRQLETAGFRLSWTDPSHLHAIRP